jgi:hypothetical protein
LDEVQGMKVKWRLRDEKYINWKLHGGHKVKVQVGFEFDLMS